MLKNFRQPDNKHDWQHRWAISYIGTLLLIYWESSSLQWSVPNEACLYIIWKSVFTCDLQLSTLFQLSIHICQAKRNRQLHARLRTDKGWWNHSNIFPNVIGVPSEQGLGKYRLTTHTSWHRQKISGSPAWTKTENYKVDLRSDLYNLCLTGISMLKFTAFNDPSYPDNLIVINSFERPWTWENLFTQINKKMIQKKRAKIRLQYVPTEMEWELWASIFLKFQVEKS